MLPPHLQKFVDRPDWKEKEKHYKKMQFREGEKKFGKEETIKKMKAGYGKALENKKK